MQVHVRKKTHAGNTRIIYHAKATSGMGSVTSHTSPRGFPAVGRWHLMSSLEFALATLVLPPLQYPSLAGWLVSWSSPDQNAVHSRATGHEAKPEARTTNRQKTCLHCRLAASSNTYCDIYWMYRLKRGVLLSLPKSITILEH